MPVMGNPWGDLPTETDMFHFLEELGSFCALYALYRYGTFSVIVLRLALLPRSGGT